MRALRPEKLLGVLDEGGAIPLMSDPHVGKVRNKERTSIKKEDKKERRGMYGSDRWEW